MFDNPTLKKFVDETKRRGCLYSALAMLRIKHALAGSSTGSKFVI
jgi:hypothetical protein